MSQDRDHLIRERAYAIWQAEGTPAGRDQDHWERAEREVAEDSAPAAKDGTGKRPRAPRKSAAQPVAAAAPADAPVKRTRLRKPAAVSAPADGRRTEK